MLKEERKQRILELLDLEQKVIASDLSIRFKVSEDTIRRDLKELDQQGLLKRVHSGALRVQIKLFLF
jgi:DeoR/GlpR family transcriptional regulator of sugar metabolism